MYNVFVFFSLIALINGFTKSYKNHHLLNHNWYVIGKTSDFPTDQAKKIIINEIPISIWRDKHNNFAGISDICPHRGASLSKGRIDNHMNCLVCPYHTFKYNNKGRMVQTPGKKNMRTSKNFNLQTDIPYYKVSNFKDWIYLYNEPMYEIAPLNFPSSNTIWHEPEGYDPEYRYVLLEKEFNIDARTVTENSLDILHISEVHTFGNKKRPLPLSDHIEIISEGHVKASYRYETSEDSMAYKIFRIKELIVENEYILPHYTVARVKFGPYTNTIITSALPTSQNKTQLFVKAYRNNWVFDFEPLNYVFDKITENMMEKTLNEDKGVIDTIYYEHRDGNFITKYDELVKKYRHDYNKFINKK